MKAHIIRDVSIVLAVLFLSAFAPNSLMASVSKISPIGQELMVDEETMNAAVDWWASFLEQASHGYTIEEIAAFKAALKDEIKKIPKQSNYIQSKQGDFIKVVSSSSDKPPHEVEQAL